MHTVLGGAGGCTAATAGATGTAAAARRWTRAQYRSNSSWGNACRCCRARWTRLRVSTSCARLRSQTALTGLNTKIWQVHAPSRYSVPSRKTHICRLDRLEAPTHRKDPRLSKANRFCVPAEHRLGVDVLLAHAWSSCRPRWLRDWRAFCLMEVDPTQGQNLSFHQLQFKRHRCSSSPRSHPPSSFSSITTN